MELDLNETLCDEIERDLEILKLRGFVYKLSRNEDTFSLPRSPTRSRNQERLQAVPKQRDNAFADLSITSWYRSDSSSETSTCTDQRTEKGALDENMAVQYSPWQRSSEFRSLSHARAAVSVDKLVGFDDESYEERLARHKLYFSDSQREDWMANIEKAEVFDWLYERLRREVELPVEDSRGMAMVEERDPAEVERFWKQIREALR